MKKNGLLTFIFACIPGAGEMYYGYMKRGLSLITMFCLAFALATIFSPLAILAPIIWMYSFFDTYDLIRYLVKGDPKPDEFVLVGGTDVLKNLALDHNKLIGWVFIGLGVWAVYDGVLSPALGSLLYRIFGDDCWYILNRVPTLVVAVLLVFLGCKLLGFTGRKQTPPVEEIPPYPTEK